MRIGTLHCSRRRSNRMLWPAPAATMALDTAAGETLARADAARRSPLRSSGCDSGCSRRREVAWQQAGDVCHDALTGVRETHCCSASGLNYSYCTFFGSAHRRDSRSSSWPKHCRRVDTNCEASFFTSDTGPQLQNFSRCSQRSLLTRLTRTFNHSKIAQQLRLLILLFCLSCTCTSAAAAPLIDPRWMWDVEVLSLPHLSLMHAT